MFGRTLAGATVTALIFLLSPTALATITTGGIAYLLARRP